MKKTIAAIALAVLASTAFAQHHGHGHYAPRHHHSYAWVAPAIVLGAVTYELSRPVQPVYTPQPQYFQSPPLCSNVLTAPPPGYRYVYQYDPYYGCTRGYLTPY